MTRPNPESIPGRPRLRDVAVAAGVSRSTVSRVLSGSTQVSPHAAAAVHAASTQLGYRPDPNARAMRGGATGCIGMLVPGIGNPFFAELVEAVERALQLAGLELILTDSQDSVENEVRRVTSLVTRKIDGLLVIPVDHEASTAALHLAAQHMPVVQLDRQVDGFAGDFVGVDNSAGVRAVVDHLVQRGVHRLAFVSGEASTSTGRSRLNAFDAVMRAQRSAVADKPVLGTFTLDFGQKAVRELLGRGSLPEALVCGSDIIALGLVRELRERGAAVPDEVLVTGFDGIPFHELADPSLTTIRQPLPEIAAESVRLLLSRLGGDQGPPRRSEIAPALQIRQSSTRRVT